MKLDIIHAVYDRAGLELSFTQSVSQASHASSSPQNVTEIRFFHTVSERVHAQHTHSNTKSTHA